MDKKLLKRLPEELVMWYDAEACLLAVKQDGGALWYVKDQTPAICLAAVEEDTGALLHVDLASLDNSDIEEILTVCRL